MIGIRDERQSWRDDDGRQPRQVRESYRSQDREGIKDDRDRPNRYRPRSLERDGHGHNRSRSRFTRDNKYRDSRSPRRDDQKYDDNGRWKERRRSRSLDAKNGGDEKRRRVG